MKREEKMEFLRFVYKEMRSDSFAGTCSAYRKDLYWISETRELLKWYALNLDNHGHIKVEKIPEEHREQIARLNDIVISHLLTEGNRAIEAGFISLDEIIEELFEDSLVLRGIITE